MYDDEGREGTDREEYARSHPIRARILALHEQGDLHSPSTDELLPELTDVGATAPLVAYHLRVLSNIGMLPQAHD